MEQNNKIILFQEKGIRREWHNDEWYFSIIDIISVLTDSPKPTAYWNKVEKALKKESNQFYPFWIKLKMQGIDGKLYKTDATNTEGVLRIIMSIPSPKAEPIKQWLAQVGTQHIAEIENPELLTDRQGDIYRAKGYPEEWIGRRLQTIDRRKALTDEWKARGVVEGKEYSILTAEIAKATFGITPFEHSKLKGLERQNLRDHMTPLELIFTALSEEATRAVTVKQDAQGFSENHEAAVKGGTFAGNARRNYEKEFEEHVVSPTNFLKQIQDNMGTSLLDESNE